MNGDQFQYEIDNAGVPLEHRTDYPFCSFDANDWAKAFVLQNPEFDFDLARAWFANALMRGYDEHAMRELRATLALPVREPWWVRWLTWGAKS